MPKAKKSICTMQSEKYPTESVHPRFELSKRIPTILKEVLV
jgi:hypothetical protein